MSNTENTRPLEVLLADPSVKRVFNRTYIDEPKLLSGGAGSSRFGTKSKHVRHQSAKAVRQHAKASLRRGRLLDRTDTDTIDITPITKQKRSVSWRHEVVKQEEVNAEDTVTAA